jgi:hypothetical protein
MGRHVWTSALKLCVFLVLALLPLSADAANEKHFLKNLRVQGTLSDGGVFNGKFTVTRFGYDEAKGLTVDGFLHGTVSTATGQVVEDFEQSVTGVPATLNESATEATCDILNLDIGAINLNLLGLVLDLSPISLDLTAVSGAGNLLGNLLCAVAGLLDPLGFLDILLGTLEDLLGLLEAINSIIG